MAPKASQSALRSFSLSLSSQPHQPSTMDTPIPTLSTAGLPWWLQPEFRPIMRRTATVFVGLCSVGFAGVFALVSHFFFLPFAYFDFHYSLATLSTPNETLNLVVARFLFSSLSITTVSTAAALRKCLPSSPKRLPTPSTSISPSFSASKGSHSSQYNNNSRGTSCIVSRSDWVVETGLERGRVGFWVSER